MNTQQAERAGCSFVRSEDVVFFKSVSCLFYTKAYFHFCEFYVVNVFSLYYFKSCKYFLVLKTQVLLLISW